MGGLVLDRVAASYGPRTLFAGVCARVAPGDILVVTGANGSGKSTLLRVVSGLLRPAEGTVRCEVRLGYVAPDVSLYAELTGRENLAFFAGLRGVADTHGPLMARVGLPRRSWDAPTGSYSSGMRQRLKLAASLLGGPPLLVWDEPTLALDAAGGECVAEILDGHRRAGGLAVVATNAGSEADRWSRGGGRLHLGDG